MNKKILVAGLGNVFSGDGGFGPAVTFALRERTWPNGVEIVDFGGQNRELAVALTRGLDAVIFVDTVARGGKPGTLYVIEDPGTEALQMAAEIGEIPRFVRLVGCEPASRPAPDEIAHGLSPAVEAAIAQATKLVAQLVREVQCA
ncbi:MAG TPA: hydrogenase maturation protease [Kofleriaceae bacterium]|nr:hydrogenase maturation protease [Kofleriaceae bacterium]